MKNKILLLLVIILLPFTIISSFRKSKTDFNLPKQSKETIQKKDTKEITVSVNLVDENKVVNLDLESYIVGVVAGEMPASYSTEALQCQAIAARSYVVNYMEENKNYNLTNTTSNQVYLTTDQMKAKWNSNYEKYYNKILMAVESTKNKVMKYDGKTIKAFYFAVSNGYTEDVKNVFGGNLPYLKSVESDDSNYKNYVNTINISKEDFCLKLKITNCEEIKISNIIKDNTNRISSLVVNDKMFKGTDFRQLLALKSTDFVININNNKVTITTKGSGHGVGMSQYGAEVLAKKGYNYEQILKKYYQGIEIENI